LAEQYCGGIVAAAVNFSPCHASGGTALVKSDSQKREDEILLRMLQMPPKPHAEMKLKNKTKEPKALE